MSVSATLIALAIGIPLGTVLALARSPGARLVTAVVNTGMAVPTVVVGLVVAAAAVAQRSAWRPRADLHPARHGHRAGAHRRAADHRDHHGGTASLPPDLPDQLRALGASRTQLVLRLWLEARLPLLAAAMAGFGHAVSEVGAATIVGGNLHGRTQVMTTAIVENVGRGDLGGASCTPPCCSRWPSPSTPSCRRFSSAVRRGRGPEPAGAAPAWRPGGAAVDDLWSPRVSGWRCSARTGRARPRCCACSPASSVPTEGRRARGRVRRRHARPSRRAADRVRHAAAGAADAQRPAQRRAAAGLARCPALVAAARGLAALERLGVAHLADRPAGGCRAASGSESTLPGRSRSNPALLLLDEPAAALDPAARAASSTTSTTRSTPDHRRPRLAPP